MSIITLTTDYGLKDHFVGAIKGKILTEFLDAKIIDISHDIAPFNIAETSYIVHSAYNSFPKGSVHLIGVDIELNEENKHLVVQFNDHFFICADNGILSMLIQKTIPQKIVEISIHDRLLDSSTDMDVFIKVACHLAKGGSLSVIGKETKSIKNITEIQATNDENTIKGNVIYIDRFGNTVTNITKKMFLEHSKNRNYHIAFKHKTIKTILNRYSDIGISGKFPIKDYEGERLAIFNEAGFLEICIFRSNPESVGSASTLLGLNYRDVVSINFTNN